jgi:phage-related protein
MLVRMKTLKFLGSALSDLRAFPDKARQEAGYQLDKVQNGFLPDDWKTMLAIGQGVQEIRIKDQNGAFRVIYVAKFSEAVFVLHCFQKKTQKTAQADIQLATDRYNALLREMRQ